MNSSTVQGGLSLIQPGRDIEHYNEEKGKRLSMSQPTKIDRLPFSVENNRWF
jgi:hypothetical protein